MNFRKLVTCSLPAGLLAAGLGGCLPTGSNQAEEQKEPHFLAGRARVNSLDFHGAIESYAKALEVNPRSSSAHFELGCLFDDREPDPAAAIYHYDRYLKLRPNAGNAELVKQRIYRCKQELAKAVMPLPVTPTLQRDFEQLADENKRLHDEVEKWRAYYASHAGAFTNPPGQMLVLTRVPAPPAATPPPAPTPPTNRPAPPPATPAAPRKHTIKAGETPYGVARQYGVKLDALLAANPTIDPKRLKVGQTLNIPVP